MLTWLIGEAVVGGIVPLAIPLLVRTVLAFALGNGLLGLALLLLGSLGHLDVGGLLVVMSVMAVVAVSLIVHRAGGRRSLRWKPEPASGWEAFVIGSASGLVTYALLTCFLPEIASDATREHLPLTRQIWETGSTGGLTWWTANQPIHAQLVSAVNWAAGGDVGVKLSHALVGLAAVAAVGSLALLLAGRAAAVMGAVIFATIPIIGWQLGHAYVDLYPVLFCTGAALAIVIWQQGGRRAMLAIGGALAGFAFAAKVVSASAIASIGLALACVGRTRNRLTERAGAVLVFALGGLITLPWLYWGYQKTGSIPGLEYALDAILDRGSSVSGLFAGFGIGRDPMSIATIPWAATFQGERFAEIGMGLFGILPLMTLPALLFVPRTRTVAFVAVAALIGYLGWALSVQYLRYGLPVLALTCALLGAGLSGLGDSLARIRRREGEVCALRASGRRTPHHAPADDQQLALPDAAAVPGWWHEPGCVPRRERPRLPGHGSVQHPCRRRQRPGVGGPVRPAHDLHRGRTTRHRAATARHSGRPDPHHPEGARRLAFRLGAKRH